MRRAHLHMLISTAAVAGVLLSPAASFAGSPNGSGGSSGGVGFSGSGGSQGSSSNPAVQPENGTVSASGNGITVSAEQSGLLTRRLRFSGTAPASDAGQVVEIERAVPASTGTSGSESWQPIAEAPVASGGSFSVIWKANHSGQLSLKAVVVPSSSAGTASAGGGSGGTGASSSPSGPATSALNIVVYRPAVATFYGPGFYGHKTACGQTLRRNTLGIASRTLPCGTKVSVLYRGHAISVPVIDRGPFANHAQWDLTEATAKALGMTGTTTIGTLAIG